VWLLALREGGAAYDDIQVHGDDPVPDGEWLVFDEYPRITWQQDAVWRRQAARAYDDLAADIEAGQDPLPRCPGEEMALRLVLEAAAEAVNDGWGFGMDPVAHLPGHRDDFDWVAALEQLFEDDDLSDLFDVSLDGVEDPEDAHNRLLGMGDYRPAAWFQWFGGSEPRDPRRPFRR